MSAKELNIGDYVRTKDNGIAKIIDSRITKKGGDIYCTVQTVYTTYITDNNLYLNDGDIIKSSSNIIDLLELRDIVELFEEDDVDGELTGFYEVLAYTTDRKEIGVRNKDGEIDLYPAENLRGIITYEQIASMEYKIGE